MAKNEISVPSSEEKQTLSDALLERMKAANAAEAAVVDLKAALGAQFAEVGNSDKMTYTDRETGEVKKWGVSPAVITREEAKANDAIARIKAALNL